LGSAFPQPEQPDFIQRALSRSPATPRFQSREFDPMSQFCDKAYSSSKQPGFIQHALSLSPQPATSNPGNLTLMSLF
jgi:hypothetical protein